MASGDVHQHDLAVFLRFDADQRFIGYGHAITCLDGYAVDTESTGSAHQIGLAARLQAVFGTLSSLDRGRNQARVGTDAQCVDILLVTAGQGDE